MPVMQSTYADAQSRWVEGMIANSEHNNIISRVVEDSAGIGFGKVAVQGSRDDTITDAEANAPYRGITVLDRTQLQDSYPEYSTAMVMTKGTVVVMASVAVDVGDPVYFVPATGVLTNVSTDNTLIPNAMWDTSTTTAGLARLRLG